MTLSLTLTHSAQAPKIMPEFGDSLELIGFTVSMGVAENKCQEKAAILLTKIFYSLKLSRV